MRKKGSLHRDEDHLVAAGSNLMEDRNTSATTQHNKVSVFRLIVYQKTEFCHLQRVVGEEISSLFLEVEENLIQQEQM